MAFLTWKSLNKLDFDESAYQGLIDNYNKLQWQQDLFYCPSSYLGLVPPGPDINYSWIINAINFK